MAKQNGVLLRFTGPEIYVRSVGEYTWSAENDWMCRVNDKKLVDALLSEGDFVVVETSNAEQPDDVRPASTENN